MEQFSTITGWIGMGLIVVAYFLISTKRVVATSAPYQLLNIFGSIGIGLNVLYQHAWPSVALQLVWIGIGTYSLLYKIKNPPEKRRHGHHPEHVVAKGRMPE